MKILPIETIKQLYEKKHSLKELGEAYGVSGETIKLHLTKQNIKIRNHRESMTMERVKEKIMQKTIGRIAWNKGLNKSKDTRVLKYSIKMKGKKRTIEFRKKLSIIKTKHIKYDICQECGRKKGKTIRKRCVFCAAKFRALNYQNGMKGKHLSEEHILALSNGGKFKQTKPEKFIEELMNFMFSNLSSYKYVGSGIDKFFIVFESGKIKRPDFVDTFHKKVIEVFGRYWHKNDNPNDLIEEYRKVGWDCLIIWDDEININTRDIIMKFTYLAEYEEELWITNHPFAYEEELRLKRVNK
jgi:hypothetical protein